MNELEKKFYTLAFKAEIRDRAEEVDPNDNEDWFSLTLGWAIGKGLTIREAYDFAIYIKYETPLG
jgi:hypothetical protein